MMKLTILSLGQLKAEPYLIGFGKSFKGDISFALVLLSKPIPWCKYGPLCAIGLPITCPLEVLVYSSSFCEESLDAYDHLSPWLKLPWLLHSELGTGPSSQSTSRAKARLSWVSETTEKHTQHRQQRHCACPDPAQPTHREAPASWWPGTAHCCLWNCPSAPVMAKPGPIDPTLSSRERILFCHPLQRPHPPYSSCPRTLSDSGKTGSCGTRMGLACLIPLK